MNVQFVNDKYAIHVLYEATNASVWSALYRGAAEVCLQSSIVLQGDRTEFNSRSLLPSAESACASNGVSLLTWSLRSLCKPQTKAAEETFPRRFRKDGSETRSKSHQRGSFGKIWSSEVALSYSQSGYILETFTGRVSIVNGDGTQCAAS